MTRALNVIWQSHKDFPCFSLPLQHKVWRLTQCLFGVASFWIRKNVSDVRHVFLTLCLSLSSRCCWSYLRDLCSVHLCRVSGRSTLPSDCSHRLPNTARSSILLLMLLLPFDRTLASFHRNVRVRSERCVTQGC